MRVSILDRIVLLLFFEAVNDQKTGRLSLVCGFPASGKTTFARKLAKESNACFLDSDQVTERLVRAGMQLADLNPNDRDSPEYKSTFREPVYETLYDLAKINLLFGDVVIAGPFTQEIRDENFDQKLAQRVQAEVEIFFIDCNAEIRKERMIRRGEKRDFAKLADWESYLASLPDRLPACKYSHIDNSI